MLHPHKLSLNPAAYRILCNVHIIMFSLVIGADDDDDDDDTQGIMNFILQ